MTEEQMRNLKPGDLVRHKSGDHAYVVTGNYGDRVTAVRTVDITNPVEWDIPKLGIAAADRGESE